MSLFQASKAPQEQNPSSHPMVKASVRQSAKAPKSRQEALIELAYHGLMTASDDGYRRLWCDLLIDAIEERA